MRLASEERGATVVIVTLLLMVIFGMLILVVDVGRLVTLRAEMIRSADSGSLAAAQSCAVGESDGEARANADQFAISNEPAIDELPNPVSYNYGIEGCTLTGGTVTVKYQGPLELIFAPILGVDADRPVTAESTAVWGPSGEANPVPFVFPSDAFGTNNCEIDFDDIENVPEGTRCSLIFDNDVFQGSVFGSLNLNQWDVDETANCSNKELNDNIHYSEVGGYDGPLDKLEVKPAPGTTYVCAGDGLADPLYEALKDQIGHILTFPITQPPYIFQANKIDKFNVIGFAALKVEAVLSPQEAGGQGTTTCQAMHSFTSNEQVLLQDLGLAEGCYSSVDGLQLEGNLQVNATGNPVCCDEGADYAFDPATNTIAWGNQPRDDVRVDFDFSVEGQCGTPPPNSSARCIVTTWAGGRIGGGVIIPGPNRGEGAIRLCDEEFGSCDLPE
ncbi:MAG: pilus assembly protein TadG-related protein [Actinomycetota bacterium]